MIFLTLFATVNIVSPVIENKISFGDSVLFTREEKKEIRKCNTAKFAFYKGGQSREFIKLMNLCRNNGHLFRKYVRYKYGREYAFKGIIASVAVYKKTNQRPYLRPSFGLHLSALSHAVASGFSGYEGHRWLDFRLKLFLNFNRYAGENCEYGSKKAIDSVINLLGSPGHRSNIMSSEYMRVGVARFYHIKYGFNYVTVFTGPKIQDFIFYRKDLKRRK